MYRTLLPVILCLFQLTPNAAVAQETPWTQSHRLEAQADYKGALAALDPLLKDSPEEYVVLRAGWLNYLGGNYGGATELYRRALNMNPESIDAALGLTLPLMAQGRWREAATYAGQVLKKAPWQYYAHVRLMACEEALGQWETLANHAAATIQRYPSDATLWVYRARAEAARGHRDEALRAYEKVLERVPANQEAVRYIRNAQAER